MQPLSWNLRPDLLTSLVNMSLVLRPPREMHLCTSSSNVPRLPTFLKLLQKPSRFLHFWQGAESRAHATQNDILTSKSGPRPSVLYTFHFQMCFVPPWRALFQHLNFQKCSEHGVLCTFWLRHALRATTAHTFSSSHFPKMFRSWCVLCILTWTCASHRNGVHFFDIATSKSAPRMVSLCVMTSKCASRHNGVQFFISHLPRRLRTLFSKPTFGPLERQNIGKTQWFTTYLPFRAPASSFFWVFLFSDLLASSLLFSDSSHLCFSSAHIVRSLTSKLPSMIMYVCMHACMHVRMYIRMYACACVCMYAWIDDLHVYLFVYWFNYLFVCLSIYAWI